MEKGFVYLITDWGSKPEKFKVGITKKNPEDRLRSLHIMIYRYRLNKSKKQ